MFRLPDALERAIDEVVSQFPAGEVARAARALSDRYLADHPAAEPILDSRLRAAAYVLTRMPATFAAARFAAEELALAVPDLAPRTVLDLGSGTGAVSWAMLDAFESLAEVNLVDYSADALALASRLLAGANVPITTAQRRLGAAPKSTTVLPAVASTACGSAGAAGDVTSHETTADLAVCGFVLGELTARARAAVVQEMTAAAPTVLIVEPGTPAGYSRILAAREHLLAAGLNLAAPCPHSRRCPLGEGDWCHMSARLPRSAAHREAKGGSRDFEDEKFAYVAATRLPVPAVPVGRVLRHPQVRPGHVLLDLCTSGGTAERVTVSKKQGTAYKAARRIAWGERWESGGAPER